MARTRAVLTLSNEVEARLLEATLEEQGIPHFIRSYHDSAYDGLFQQELGWGHVESLPEYEERIRAIYADLLEAGPAPDEPAGT
jgi:hypothetical protein